MHINKLFVLIVSLLMVISLIGCGQQGASGTNQSSADVILTLNPGNGAQDVTTAALVSFISNRELDPDSINNETIKVYVENVETPCTVSYDEAEKKVTLSITLTINTKYKIYIAGVLDKYGRTIKNYIWEFDTDDVDNGNNIITLTNPIEIENVETDAVAIFDMKQIIKKDKVKVKAYILPVRVKGGQYYASSGFNDMNYTVRDGFYTNTDNLSGQPAETVVVARKLGIGAMAEETPTPIEVENKYIKIDQNVTGNRVRVQLDMESIYKEMSEQEIKNGMHVMEDRPKNDDGGGFEDFLKQIGDSDFAKDVMIAMADAYGKHLINKECWMPSCSVKIEIEVEDIHGNVSNKTAEFITNVKPAYYDKMPKIGKDKKPPRPGDNDNNNDQNQPALYVNGTYPGHENNNAILDSHIHINFSSNINTQTVVYGSTININSSYGKLSVNDLLWTNNDTSLEIIPSNNLEPNTTYTVQLMGGIQNENGDQLYNGNGFSFYFTTENAQYQPAFYISGMNPSQNSYDVSVDTTIYFEFSSQVATNTIDQSSLQIYSNNGSVSIDNQVWTGDQHNLEIIPSSPLNPNTTYTISLSGSIYDTSGNQLYDGGGYQTEFTTENI